MPPVFREPGEQDLVFPIVVADPSRSVKYGGSLIPDFAELKGATPIHTLSSARRRIS